MEGGSHALVTEPGAGPEGYLIEIIRKSGTVGGGQAKGKHAMLRKVTVLQQGKCLACKRAVSRIKIGPVNAERTRNGHTKAGGEWKRRMVIVTRQTGKDKSGQCLWF